MPLKRRLLRQAVAIAATLGLLLALGWWTGELRVRSTDAAMRKNLLRQTVSIAKTINSELARKLTFTAADKTNCHECGTELTIDVQKSAAGYYIGFWCPSCGPYSRERGYSRNRQQAQMVISVNTPVHNPIQTIESFNKRPSPAIPRLSTMSLEMIKLPLSPEGLR